MISLEQIRLLESKISRALELIRVLKEENTTLRKGLESAQKKMKELETLVDGFKVDQKEIETVIVRTLHNLDELEESTAAGRKVEQAGSMTPGASASPAAASPSAASPTGPSLSARRPDADPAAPTPDPGRIPAPAPEPRQEREAGRIPPPPRPKEELDIF